MPSRSSDRMAVCLTLTRALAHTRSLPEIYNAALDALQQGLSISRASILLFDADGVMRFKAWRGLSDAYRRAVEGHTPWTPDTADAEPFVVANVANEPSLSKVLPTIQAEGIAAMAFIPLVSLDRVIGKFMLYDTSAQHLTPDDLQLAEVIASQVAFAVERRRAEDLASRSAARLGYALEAANMGTWDWDLTTNQVRWSENLERLHGAAPGTFDGTFASYAREIHPDDRARVGASIDRAFREGAPHHVEYRIVAADGTIRWVEGKGAIERGPDGSPVSMSGVCMDITPRKIAEEARAKAFELSMRASARLGAIVQSSGDAIVSKDLDGIITSWNRAAEQLFGYSEADAIGRSIMIIIPDDRLAEEAHVLARIRAGQTVEMETVRERKDGTFVQISLMVSPIFDEHGHIIGASKVARDITLRKQQENERAELQRRLAFLAETTRTLSRSADYTQTLADVARLAVPEIADWCAIDLIDDSGALKRIAMAHRDPAKLEAARDFARRYPDAMLPASARDVIRSGEAAIVADVSPEWLAAHTPDVVQRNLLRTFELTSYVCAPMLSADQPIGTLLFAMAESGRRLTDRDLPFVQDVAARAALAVENALAYHRVNEANRLKDEFLATLSHELRTPLNAILGYAQMMKAGVLAPDATANATAVITRNAESLKQIIHDVLDVSRITSGKLRLDIQPVDLHEIVAYAVATVRPAADAKGVVLQAAFGANLPTLPADPDRLQQIVWNLVSNAVKFTPAGGHVQVAVRAAHGIVEIVVSDNGQGIEPSFLPHMFERFRQADSRFAREHGGLGLGLAIVRDLAELHGGTVTATSDGPDRGATFTVRLPIARTYAPPPQSSRAESPLNVDTLLDLPPLTLRGRRILAVDDEEDSLALLRLILESTGAEVTTTDSAVGALDLLRERTFDALIADIGMPGMDGLEMMRNIRRSLPAPANALPAAALTAYARSEDRSTALASGFQVHLTKPVNAVDLVQKIAALMS